MIKPILTLCPYCETKMQWAQSTDHACCTCGFRATGITLHAAQQERYPAAYLREHGELTVTALSRGIAVDTDGQVLPRPDWSAGARKAYEDFEVLLHPRRTLGSIASTSSVITRPIDPRPCEPLRPEDANWGEE